MSIFNKIFGDPDNKDTNESPVGWSNLTEIKQLDGLVAESFSQPVFIFKHSTRCNISGMALKQFERYYSLENEAKAYFLDLLRYRSVSNEIERHFGVVHQSPQMILIMDGKCVYTVSHSDIDADELKIRISEHQK